MSNKIFSVIEKKYGKGSIRNLGDDTVVDIDIISTQSNAIDTALGIGGIPRGRITEIYGPESSGKTTLTMHVMAQAQHMGLKAAMIDAEHAFDPKYARNLGIDVDSLAISQPDSGEEGLDICRMLVESGEFGVVVVDSVSSLVPKAELAGDIGDSHVGLQARLMSQSMRILTGAVKRTNTALIFINQIREKVGVMYGSPETTSGGRALKFYSSVRIDIRRTGSIKSGDDVLGNTTKVTIKKNKLAPPFKVATFNIMFGVGIDSSFELLKEALGAGLITKNKSWFRWKPDDEPIAQGEVNAVQWVKENKSLIEKHLGNE